MERAQHEGRRGTEDETAAAHWRAQHLVASSHQLEALIREETLVALEGPASQEPAERWLASRRRAALASREAFVRHQERVEGFRGAGGDLPEPTLSPGAGSPL